MNIECPYVAKVIEKVENRPGTWNSLRIGVYRRDLPTVMPLKCETSFQFLERQKSVFAAAPVELIGEYVRNYHSYAESTFYPFQSKGKWYALYSKDYTCTRLMSLPDCKDLGGEEPDSCGFCPVEMYVPQVCLRKFAEGEVDPKPYNPRHDINKWATKEPTANGFKYTWADNEEFKAACAKSDKEWAEWDEKHPYETQYAPFGFIAGCFWGADFAWQIMFVDLLRAEQGELSREDRFDGIWLPGNLSLKDAINVSGYDHDNQTIEIALPIKYKITGERVREGLSKNIEID